MNLSDYEALIPPPNNIAPMYMDWLRGNTQGFVDNQAFLADLYASFDIETAVGVQLDVIGQILNQPRIVDFDPGAGQSGELDDYYYRLVLKAKILKNHWRGTKQEIYDFWNTYFPDFALLILDNQDMSIDVLVVGVPNDLSETIPFAYDDEYSGYDIGWWAGYESLLRGLIRHNYFFPKPAGVQVHYTFFDGVAFGYDIESPFIQGYDESTWLTIA